MPSINDDIQWLLDAQKTLTTINGRIERMIPENPERYDSTQMAHIFSAQAIRGCEQTVRYLRKAVKQAMGE